MKEKKLANIYSGRKLKLIYKKVDNEKNALINLKMELQFIWLRGI